MPSGSSHRVLDLGANPYMLTYALARAGHSVVASGHPRPVPQPGLEWVRFVQSDAEVEFSIPLYRFNVEADPFPFEDGSFDVVLCGELIEHLANGPDRMLHECNRVLARGGRLLLSTPNAVSLARLISIVRGVNPDWPFSDQGIYARHNRLYSLTELHDLLIGNGFSPYVAKGLTLVPRRSWYRPGFAGSLKWAAMNIIFGTMHSQPYRYRRFADGLLLAAIKVKGPRRYRPGWLFGAADSVPMIAGAFDA
jgi:SAM-dependent methyltransferase